MSFLIQLLDGTTNKIIIEYIRLQPTFFSSWAIKFMFLLTEKYCCVWEIPGVLEDAWVSVAPREKERAKKIIDELPKVHTFEIRYTEVEKIDWESCRKVLDCDEKKQILSTGW